MAVTAFAIFAGTVVSLIANHDRVDSGRCDRFLFSDLPQGASGCPGPPEAGQRFERVKLFPSASGCLRVFDPLRERTVIKKREPEKERT